MAMGPGVDSAMATTSASSSTLIQPRRLETSSSIRDIMAYPPPKVKSPILKNVANNLVSFSVILKYLETKNVNNRSSQYTRSRRRRPP